MSELREYYPHLKWRYWKGERTDSAAVRLFEIPVAAEDESGIPVQDWVWTCNFTIEGECGIVEAAQTAPPVGSVRPMMRRARNEGCKKLRWQRLDHGVIREVVFDLLEDSAS